MGQVYLQRFDYMGPVAKPDFEQTWGEALQTFARTGNWRRLGCPPELCEATVVDDVDALLEGVPARSAD